MQTRRLRLGDVVDDYCPRERRLSNHVIVAMVDDTIKQTRCSTCDFEHPYKEAKVPPRRKKKDAPSALFQQVLENVTTERVTPPAPAAPPALGATPEGEVAPAPPEAIAVATPAPAAAPAPAVAAAAAGATPRPAAAPRPRAVKPAGRVAPPAVGAAPVLVTPVVAAPPAAAAAPPANASASPESASSDMPNANIGPMANGDANQPPHDEDNAPLHRRSLIRAQLPRPVGEVPVRQPPSFTIREAAAARPNKFRYKGRPQGAGGRQGRPQGVGVSGNQARPGGGRGPQARGAGKKSGAHQPHQHRAGGHQSARGPKGPHGNKRFK